MKKVLNTGALALVFLLCNGAPFFAAAKPAISTIGKCAPETIIIELIVADYQATWTPLNGGGPYNVIVIDLTTNLVHGRYTTSDNRYLFTNLVSGHTYNFTVTNGSLSDTLTTTI